MESLFGETILNNTCNDCQKQFHSHYLDDNFRCPACLKKLLEYVEGKPLDEYIRDVTGPIPEKVATHLMLEILSGFSYAHTKGLIHRDIKPANIMRRDLNGDYVLLDAGLAFDTEGDSISVSPVGTPLFL